MNIISLIGCVNVGKSTLFNCLTKTNHALTGKQFGLTRDYHFTSVIWKQKKYHIYDTGGIFFIKNSINDKINQKTFFIIQISDIVLFIVDGNFLYDKHNIFISNFLKIKKKITFLILNKIENINVSETLNKLYFLNFGKAIPISSLNNINIHKIINSICSVTKNCNISKKNFSYVKKINFIKNNKKYFVQKKLLFSKIKKIAIVGRTNVGKSTFINKILKQDRILVDSTNCTTTDSIYSLIQKNFGKSIFIDTAGICKKYQNSLDKLLVQKTFHSIQISDVILFMIDVEYKFFNQDFSLLLTILKLGKPIIIVVNKIDKIILKNFQLVKKHILNDFKYFFFLKICFISAVTGYGIKNLFQQIYSTIQLTFRKFNTSYLTKILHKAIKSHKKIFIHGNKIKFKCANFGGYNPITIFVYIKNTIKKIPNFYVKYLLNYFYKSLKMHGFLIQIIFK